MELRRENGFPTEFKSKTRRTRLHSESDNDTYCSNATSLPTYKYSSRFFGLQSNCREFKSKSCHEAPRFPQMIQKASDTIEPNPIKSTTSSKPIHDYYSSNLHQQKSLTLPPLIRTFASTPVLPPLKSVIPTHCFQNAQKRTENDGKSKITIKSWIPYYFFHKHIQNFKDITLCTSLEWSESDNDMENSFN